MLQHGELFDEPNGDHTSARKDDAGAGMPVDNKERAHCHH
jgi:hypothetical protein